MKPSPSNHRPNGHRLVWSIDIGGTNTRLGAVDSAGRVVTLAHCGTPKSDTGAALVTWITETMVKLQAKLGAGSAPCNGCIALPGIIDEAGGCVVRSVNLPPLEGFPFATELAKATDIEWSIVTDAGAATWGEYVAVQRSMDLPIGNFAHIRLGTGVALGLVLDGRLQSPRDRENGHPTILQVDGRNERCRCGGRGCLEAIASGTALTNQAHSAGYEGVAALSAQFDQGEPRAVEIVRRAAKALGQAFRKITDRYSIDTIVVGGGVAEALPTLVEQAATCRPHVGHSLAYDSERNSIHQRSQATTNVQEKPTPRRVPCADHTRVAPTRGTAARITVSGEQNAGIIGAALLLAPQGPGRRSSPRLA